ncbi:MAG: hypothetical protein ACLQVL_11120 [Terriglobia bacterium]
MPRFPNLLFVLLLFACSGSLFAQDTPSTPAGAPPKATPPARSNTQAEPHKFWDTENILLFAGVGGARMMDYASTRHLRDQGNNEWLLTNSIVDNRPLFVGIELAGTAASIGVSYLFHRSGHHSLERWTSIVHIGVGVGGSVRNYLLKPPQLVVVAQPAIGPGIAFQPVR